MEWEEIERLQAEHHQNQQRAASDLDYARQSAKKALQSQRERGFSSKAHGKELKNLLEALAALSAQSKSYIERVEASLGHVGSLSTLHNVVYEAHDWMQHPGRKPLPLDGAIYWLLYWRIGQGNKTSNMLQDSKSKELRPKPSPMLSFLHGEFLKMEEKVTIEQIHNTLRRSDVRRQVKKIKADLSTLQK